MQGKVCVVTGANSGIGKAIALELARRQAQVVLVCRNEAQAVATQQELATATGNPCVEVQLADLAVQAEVRGLAAALARRYPHIHVLVNNAGVQRYQRTLTPDGLEETFAVNHLAPFLLTSLLLEPLHAAAPARIITTASVVHRWGKIHFDDLHGERSYNSNRAYYQSKLANVLFTFELARRLDPAQVTVNCFAPGLVRTAFSRDFRGFYRLMARLMLRFAKSPAQGAATAIMLACDPALADVTGGYFANNRMAQAAPAARDPALAWRLWEVSARLVGLPEEMHLPQRTQRTPRS
ncbi:MAG: SDR family oxidoreductase [Chloroflexaceae bacterium]|jgi:NAD(P)-dependent dehydrogenase (short-subunit alcohol dehydrogenase family)|nr:SDR family oxidoreductase [Chloroflexaceae bacterium]